MQKDKQEPIRHDTEKTKDRAAQTQLKPGVKCSGWIENSTSGPGRVTLLISGHAREMKHGIVTSS